MGKQRKVRNTHASSARCNKNAQTGSPESMFLYRGNKESDLISPEALAMNKHTKPAKPQNIRLAAQLGTPLTRANRPKHEDDSDTADEVATAPIYTAKGHLSKKKGM